MKPDLYLKFDDEAAAKAALFIQLPVLFDGEGEPIEFESVPRFQNLYIPPAGRLYRETETGDPENPVEHELLPGYHANVLLIDGEDGSDLAQYCTDPDTPIIAWVR